jgi:predicted MPP superfamily phosphohydrolase
VQPADEARLGIVLLVVLGIYVTAALVVIRWCVKRVRGRVLPIHGANLWLARMTLGLAALGLVCLAYGRDIEPNWLEVTHVRLETAKLRKGIRPVRIVQISDLHSEATPGLEEKLPAVIAGEKPDLVLFTGDAINSPDGLPIFKRCLRRVAAVAPTFAVTGNWDVGFWGNLDLFGGTGVQVLDGDARKVNLGRAELWVAGAAFGNEMHIRQALEALPARFFSVSLYHSPDAIEDSAAQKCDLFCVGHTHGGQVALPFYGALVILSKFGKRYESGLYRVGRTWLYVNRGIGMEGGFIPRVRFCVRPEVTVFELIGVG